MSQAAHEIPGLDIDSGAMAALEDELSSAKSVRSVKNPLQLLVEDMSDKMFMSFATSVATLAVITICVALIAWNLLYRSPDLNQLNTLDYDIQEKRLLVNDLTTSLGAINDQEIDYQIDAEYKRIFNSYHQLAIWMNEAGELATALNLDMSYRVGNIGKTKIRGTIEVPITLTFVSATKNEESVFSNSMELIKQLLSENWHLDIVSTKAIGNPSGLSSLQTTFQVWVSAGSSTEAANMEALSKTTDRNKRINEEFTQ
ncbi:MAG: hypothetical protein V3U76_17650 [Granulosicoccus sp.]